MDRPKYVHRPNRQPHFFSLLSFILGPTLAFAGLVVFSATPAAAAVPPCAGTGGAMQIVAHTDDDLLFLSPDFMRDIQAKRCVQTVFTTAGEAGEGASYWRSLEAGIRASYSKMAGVSDSWTTSDAGVPNRPLTMQTLNGAPNISVVFMRLPDGFPNGDGSAAYNDQSILKLWDGRLSSIRPVDNAATFTKSQFQTALNRLVPALMSNWTTAHDQADTVHLHGSLERCSAYEPSPVRLACGLPT